MMFKWLSRSVVLMALFVSQSALADVGCISTVGFIDFEGGGIAISTSFGRLILCSLSYNTTNTVAHYGTATITPQLCQGLLATVLTARASGKSMAFYLGADTCPTANFSEYPYAIISLP